MSIEEAKCLVIRTASLSVASINNLVNEGVTRRVLYDINAMEMIIDRIKIFLRNGFLEALSLATFAGSLLITGSRHLAAISWYRLLLSILPPRLKIIFDISEFGEYTM
jgi:hypothetical protein